jgi:hypothetical protein
MQAVWTVAATIPDAELNVIGMAERPREFVDKGSELYAKA